MPSCTLTAEGFRPRILFGFDVDSGEPQPAPACESAIIQLAWTGAPQARTLFLTGAQGLLNEWKSIRLQSVSWPQRKADSMSLVDIA